MIFTELELYLLIKKSIKILRKNYSCPGVDGISYQIIKKDLNYHINLLLRHLDKLNDGSLQFNKPRIVSIIDANKKERIIYVYTIYDRILQLCIKLKIEKKCYNIMSNSILSHKRGVDIKQEYNAFLESMKKTDVLEFDIKNYYTSINKVILYNKLKEIDIPDEIISIMNNSMKHCKDGIPPGNCLSPLLSDVYLTSVDSEINNPFIRYSDDYTVRLLNENIYTFMDRIMPIIEMNSLKMNMSKVKVNGMPIKTPFL